MLQRMVNDRRYSGVLNGCERCFSLTKRAIFILKAENKNKYMKPNTELKVAARWRQGVLTLVSVIVLFGLGLTSTAGATNYQAQINNLNVQNAQSQSALSGLQIQATSYQQAITAYQNQINAIDNSIAANQARQAYYDQQIAQDEAKIAQNKTYLANDLKTMYVQGQMSMIEQLATSNNLSTFVNQQEDSIKVQDYLDGLLTSIKQLQTNAQNNRNQVTALLKTEQAQQAQVATDEAQQNNLLSMNQTQQDSYNQQIAANNSEIATLRAEQAAAMAAITRGVSLLHPSNGSGGACDIGYGNGGYPSTLCDAPQDAILDSAGFPNRECTSFAYWYFTTQEGQSSFQVNGNAGWWWETSNYAVSTYPNVQPGAIGVEPSSALNAPVPSLHGGYYGHVMIVLALPGTTYNGQFPYTNAVAGTSVPQGYVLVMSMNEDEAGHFMYNFWPVNYLMYINPQ